MKVERKPNGQISIEMESYEALILESILHYKKDEYFKDLDATTESRVSIIDPRLFKDVYNKLLNQLEL